MVQRDQGRIVTAGEGGDALVGRFVGSRGAAQVQAHAPVQALVFSQVCGAQLRGAFACGLGQLRGGDGFRIAADIIEGAVAGSGDQAQLQLTHAIKGDVIGADAQLAANVAYLHTERKTQFAGHTVARHVVAADQPTVIGAGRAGGMFVGGADEAAHRLTLFHRVAQHQALIDRRDEYLAAVQAGTGAERGAGNGRIQVQLAAVIADAFQAMELQPQVAQRLVRHLFDRP